MGWQTWIALISLVVAFMALRETKITRRQRIAANRQALKAALDICTETANRFVNPEDGHYIGAPAYRFPSPSFGKALQNLLDLGALSECQAKGLVEYNDMMALVNRGLDAVSALPLYGGGHLDSQGTALVQRNIDYATHLLPTDSEKGNCHTRAAAIIEDMLSSSSFLARFCPLACFCEPGKGKTGTSES